MGARLRRLTTAAFVVLLFASVALISVNAGGGVSDGLRYAVTPPDTQVGQTTYDAVGGGDSDGDPYLIGNATQLKDLADAVNGAAGSAYEDSPDNLSGKYIRLTSDIDLSEFDATYSSGYNGWVPIGNYSTGTVVFKGNFDGAGWIIDKFFTGTNYVRTGYFGLFGYIEDADISNLSVSGNIALIHASESVYVGTIAGYAKNSDITDCTNKVTTTIGVDNGSRMYMGGITGCLDGGVMTRVVNEGNMTIGSHAQTENYSGAYEGGITAVLMGGGSIVDSFNMGTVTNNTWRTGQTIGGIAASVIDGSAITGCHNDGSIVIGFEVINSNNIGGIAGSINGSYIANSYNTSPMVVRNGNSGGIAGYATAASSIADCYNTATLTTPEPAQRSPGSAIIGGIAGNSNEANIISGCYNIAAVTTRGSLTGTVAYAGGIAGSGGTIIGCYNTAAVSASGATGVYAGGIAGANNGAITDSYSTGSVTATGAATVTTTLTTAATANSYVYAGGIAGSNGAGAITNCYSLNGVTATATATATATGTGAATARSYIYAGGIAGNNGAGAITSCYSSLNGVMATTSATATATATTTADSYIFAGGIVGNGTGAINSSYNPGNVTATATATAATTANSYVYAGGIAGNNGAGGAITGSYNTGNVRTSVTAAAATANSHIDAGGMVGYSRSNITNSYSAASVSTVGGINNYAGGIVGNRIAGTIGDGCYYNNEKFSGNAVGNGVSPEGAGKTMEQMTDDGTLSGEMSLLGGTFVKRENDLQSDVRYYPELADFKNSQNEATKDASLLSVTVFSIFYHNVDEAENGNLGYYTTRDLPFILVPASRPGYTTEWYDNVQLDGDVATGIAEGLTGTKEFWAKWVPIIYDIAYVLNGGTNAENPTNYTIETATITLAASTKRGYIFGGWYDNEQFSGNALTSIAIGSFGDKTLYARWTAIVYDIAYVLDGGTNAENPVTYTIEGAVTLAAPTREGYTFGGWYETADFSGDAVTGIAADSVGNKMLYARWTKNGNPLVWIILLFLLLIIAAAIYLYMRYKKLRAGGTAAVVATKIGEAAMPTGAAAVKKATKMTGTPAAVVAAKNKKEAAPSAGKPPVRQMPTPAEKTSKVTNVKTAAKAPAKTAIETAPKSAAKTAVTPAAKIPAKTTGAATVTVAAKNKKEATGATGVPAAKAPAKIPTKATPKPTVKTPAAPAIKTPAKTPSKNTAKTTPKKPTK
jgi:uncharacterized repeat protein (TIGR02543 family)